MKILHIDSSIAGPAFISRKLSRAFFAHLSEAASDVIVVRSDLTSEPLPYFEPALVNRSAPDLGITLSATVLQEFMFAEVIVIGVPMYSCGIPA